MKKILLIILLIGTSIFAQFDDNDKESSKYLNSITVTIGGDFIVNGSFPASPFERVDQFVTRIFNLFRTEGLGAIDNEDEINRVLQKVDNYARRDIILRSSDGKDSKIDLEKFRLTGDFKYNPYLKNDDVLIFPGIDLDRNFVSIDGAVNKSRKVQFVDGDRLSDAILFGQGINKAYEGITQVEITRLSYDGRSEEILRYNLESGIELKRGDRIRVLAVETNRKDFKVLVIGEVNRPGFISITKNSTTLKNVIEKAGSFTVNADLNRAELIKVTDPHYVFKYRLLTKGFEQSQLQDDKFNATLYNVYANRNIETLLMQRAANVTMEDSLGFRLDNALRLWKQQALIDFTKIAELNSDEANYILEDGDIIIVPQKNDLVYVFGQVATVGYQKFQNGKSADFYIKNAGGLTSIAKDLEDVILIKGKSRDWININDSDAKIEAGDYIWIPKKQFKTFEYYINRILPIASIIGTVATVALLIIQLNRN